MNHIYRKQTISTELGLVIGAITETQKIIDDALRLEQKGEEIKALSLIQKKIKRGDSLEKIADDLLEEIETIQSVYNIIKEYPEKTIEEIYDMLNH